MLRFADRFSPQQRYWLGFACCPLITWSSFAGFIFLLSQSHRIWGRIPIKSASYTTGFLVISGIVVFVGASLLSGFATALFWHKFTPADGNEDSAGFWSITVSWLPGLLFLFTPVPLIALVLSIPYVIFILLYVSGFRYGLQFWASNYSRQWFGDFSDFS